jgi:hypothetical protein
MLTEISLSLRGNSEIQESLLAISVCGIGISSVAEHPIICDMRRVCNSIAPEGRRKDGEVADGGVSGVGEGE